MVLVRSNLHAAAFKSFLVSQERRLTKRKENQEIKKKEEESA